MSFIATLRAERDRAQKNAAAPWRERLEKLTGSVWEDQVERVSTHAVLDYLDVPQGMRTAQACRRLAKIMIELGWTPIRARGLNRSGYRDQVRGYARVRIGQSVL